MEQTMNLPKFKNVRGLGCKLEWLCWWVRSLFTAFVAAALLSGCAYKGGKVVDGTNLAIGMKIPGTDWAVNVLDYVGGVRVAGNDSTRISVTNEVNETNTYFGCVTTQRRTRMTAEIEPLETTTEGKK